VRSGQALVVGLLLLVEAAGKVGTRNVIGMAPRPWKARTPSSAIFYVLFGATCGIFCS